jgi:F0F1-type ATP synthase assembly protein I
MRDDKRLKKRKSSVDNAAIYLSLGIEMAVAVLLAVWCGIVLDKRVGCSIPIFTFVMVPLGMFAAIWILLKTFRNKK